MVLGDQARTYLRPSRVDRNDEYGRNASFQRGDVGCLKMDPGSLGDAFVPIAGDVVLAGVLLGESDQQQSVESRERVPTGTLRVHSFCYMG